jgi:acetyltransferase
VVKLRQNERPQARATGGLALDLHEAAEVTVAAQLLTARHARRAPDAPDCGLLVQRQAARSRELRIRVADNATFGPIISFGQGGTTADIVHDIAADLPPLNLTLARSLIARTRVAAMLAHFRDMPAADVDAVAEALVRVSQLIVDFPEIAELEVNPLFADAEGVLAADAWLCLREAGDFGGGLAITPYPSELVEHWTARDGERLTIRPIRPEDAEQHGVFFHRLSPQDIRYRFFTAMREMSPEQMARLTQVDYDREMAFIAVREASGDTVAVARLVCEPDGIEGEFAVIVQGDMKGRGLATHLMRRLIDWARWRGLRAVVGLVLADNAPMLAFVRHLGFSLRRMLDEPDVVEARLLLGDQ